MTEDFNAALRRASGLSSEERIARYGPSSALTDPSPRGPDMGDLIRRGSRKAPPPETPIADRPMTMREASAVFLGTAHVSAGVLTPGPPPRPVVGFGGGHQGRTAVQSDEENDMTAVLRRAGAIQRGRKSSRYGW